MADAETFDPKRSRVPTLSTARLIASLQDTSYNLDDFVRRAKDDAETVLYLAYGSNLSNETFRGKRGITPLAQINVQVPSLRLTFDLPGLPYLEPCFANSGLRDANEAVDDRSDVGSVDVDDEKAAMLSPTCADSGYRKDRWHKGLIGVVYEVSAKDYAHIIQTEGGGSSYQDIVVDCHPLAMSDPTQPVPQHPNKRPFKAHTLFAPALPPDQPPPDDGGRLKRPDPSYAQASARYLKLMTDGAAELGLPYEYQDHLKSLRHFKITTVRQRMGQAAFLALWMPVVGAVFGLGRLFADRQGKIPAWLRRFNAAVFQTMWSSYDNVFKPAFGDGERTLTDKREGEAWDGRSIGSRSKHEAASVAGVRVFDPSEVEEVAIQMV